MTEILDCTLRDGGYYTNWDFDESFLEVYFRTIRELNIKHVEIGYRNIQTNQYYGEFFYTGYSTLSYVVENLGPDVEIYIMLDAKNITKESIGQSLKGLDEKRVTIRLASTPENIKETVKISCEIKKYGFKVAINIMYLHTYLDSKKIQAMCKSIFNNADIVYLVDSYGSCLPQEVSFAVKEFKHFLECKIGFHGHNNMELGVSNSLAAIQAGAELVDATFGGLGRGAGNTRTEIIFPLFSKLNLITQKTTAPNLHWLSRMDEKLDKFRGLYDWGANLPYIISGVMEAPQSNIMELYKTRRFGCSAIVNSSLSYNHKMIETDIEFLSVELKGATVLCIAGGIGQIRNKEVLSNFINRYSESIICVGARSIVDSEAILYNENLNKIAIFSYDELHKIDELIIALENFDHVIIIGHVSEDLNFSYTQVLQTKITVMNPLEEAFRLIKDNKHVKTLGLIGFSSEGGILSKNIEEENTKLINWLLSDMVGLEAVNFSNTSYTDNYKSIFNGDWNR
jgi:4-hydroxy 2-oxovalerate aldolase